MIALVGFVSLLITYYAVNLWIVGLHSYKRRMRRSVAAETPVIQCARARRARPAGRAPGDEGTVRKKVLWAAAAIGLLLLWRLRAQRDAGHARPNGPYAQQRRTSSSPCSGWPSVVFVVVEGGIV